MYRPWQLIAYLTAILIVAGLMIGKSPTASAQSFAQGTVYSDYLKQIGSGAIDQVVGIDTRFTRTVWDVDRYREIYTDLKFGTGFVYSDEGYIVCDVTTVYHYPSKYTKRSTNKDEGKTADYLRVTFNDGRSYAAEVVGYDFPSSLAVLKIPRMDPELLSPVTFGDSGDVVVGEPLAIIGHNYSTQNATIQVTSGIISALRTQYPSLEETENIFFQVNYPYGRGNEGGILLNLDSNMVAMITSAAPYADITEVHYALPENVIRDIVDQIIGDGEVHRPWFGFTLLDVSDELRRAYEIDDPLELDYLPELPDHVLNLIAEGEFETGVNDRGENVIYVPKSKMGMFIINVDEDSPAEDAGLVAEDILWMFQDTVITDATTLNNQLEKYDIGDMVTVTYLRRYYRKYEVFTTEFELIFFEDEEDEAPAAGKEPVSSSPHG